MSEKELSKPALDAPEGLVARLESARLVEGCVAHAVIASESAGNPFLQYLLGMAENEVARMLAEDLGQTPRKLTPTRNTRK